MNDIFERTINSIIVKKSLSLREIMHLLKTLSSHLLSQPEENLVYKKYVSSVVPNESILSDLVDFFDERTVLDVFPENGLWSYLLSKSRCMMRAVKEDETFSLFFSLEKISSFEAVHKYLPAAMFIIINEQKEMEECGKLLSVFSGDRVVLFTSEETYAALSDPRKWTLVYSSGDDLVAWSQDIQMKAFFYERVC
jgi:hypothetical protein